MRARSRPDASGSEASARERVWQIVALIPAGKVASYGQVAALAGIPNGARFTGSVLRDLPSGSRIPWHRVINAAGRISLPPGSASAQRQRELLLAEGVLVVNARVDLKRFAWVP
ncbi:MAG: MGMT family protein [Pseudomonadales bacterium]|nr:MGMT family protein [Pseudomonadales bacterium]